MNLYEMTVIVEARLQELHQQNERIRRMEANPTQPRRNNPLLPVLLLVVIGVLWSITSA